MPVSALVNKKLTEHDCARAVVGIKKSDLEVVAGLELEDSWCVEGYGFLTSMRLQLKSPLRESCSYKQVLEMTVTLDARF